MNQEETRKAADPPPEYSSGESASLSILAKELQLVADGTHATHLFRYAHMLPNVYHPECLPFEVHSDAYSKQLLEAFLRSNALRECKVVSCRTRQMGILAVIARFQARLLLMFRTSALLLRY